MQEQPSPQPKLRKRDEHLSNDGQWRPFPKVPHLLQYVSNRNYYARVKVKGKVIRESLKTTVWTTAKLRLTDFLKQCQEPRNRVDLPRFSEAVVLFERDSRATPRSNHEARNIDGCASRRFKHPGYLITTAR